MKVIVVTSEFEGSQLPLLVQTVASNTEVAKKWLKEDSSFNNFVFYETKPKNPEARYFLWNEKETTYHYYHKGNIEGGIYFEEYKVI